MPKLGEHWHLLHYWAIDRWRVSCILHLQLRFDLPSSVRQLLLKVVTYCRSPCHFLGYSSSPRNPSRKAQGFRIVRFDRSSDLGKQHGWLL